MLEAKLAWHNRPVRPSLSSYNRCHDCDLCSDIMKTMLRFTSYAGTKNVGDHELVKFLWE